MLPNFNWIPNERGTMTWSGDGLKAALNFNSFTECYVVVVRDAETLQIVYSHKNIPDEGDARRIAEGAITKYLEDEEQRIEWPAGRPAYEESDPHYYAGLLEGDR